MDGYAIAPTEGPKQCWHCNAEQHRLDTKGLPVYPTVGGGACFEPEERQGAVNKRMREPFSLGKEVVSLGAGGEEGASCFRGGPVLTKAGHGVRDTSFKGIGRVQV